jgi:hypothetical protein
VSRSPVKSLIMALLFTAAGLPGSALARTLVAMDLSQTNHLKAYGLAYWALSQGEQVEWLLNYRGGSFLFSSNPVIQREARIRGVAFEQVDDGTVGGIYKEIETANMELVLLEKAPRVAVYIPPNFVPWDDAVTLALTYAEIPFTQIWDEQVLTGELSKFDWLHLHHEDFTGQYGKFYFSFRSADWYREQQRTYEAEARRLGFAKVSEEKKAVARAIKEYVAQGGFMFAMCSATDTYDIALAAEGVDICDAMYDGDPADPNAQAKLDFSKTLSFHNFTLEMNPLVYEFSNLDTSTQSVARGAEADYFTLFEFSAKEDPVQTMLTQNHTSVINGFLGQTTGFHRDLVKKGIVLMGQVEGTKEVKYMNGNYGKGTFTFYGGHDPEDYQHAVGDPPTDLSLHPNSPGYRLILNNVLFPAAEKKKHKT